MEHSGVNPVIDSGKLIRYQKLAIFITVNSFEMSNGGSCFDAKISGRKVMTHQII